MGNEPKFETFPVAWEKLRRGDKLAAGYGIFTLDSLERLEDGRIAAIP